MRENSVKLSTHKAPLTTAIDSFQNAVDWMTPVKFTESMNAPTLEIDSESTSVGSLENFEVPLPIINNHVHADTIPLQIWEGTVKHVDSDEGVMHVVLESKYSGMDRHSAEISLEWVSDQDMDLVSNGAVFYLTLFKRTNRGSVQNSQELRFRRRPSWSDSQVNKIYAQADKLYQKLTPSLSTE